MKKIIHIFIFVFATILFMSSPALAKDKVKLFFLGSDSEVPEYPEMLKREVDVLLKSRYSVDYEVLKFDFSDNDKTQALLQNLFNDESVTCIVGTSLGASEALIHWGEYSKPVIAGGVLDRKLQGLPKTKNGTSGIKNFNYVETPFDIEKDLLSFKKLFDFKHIAILYNPSEPHLFHYFLEYLGKLFERVTPDAKFSMVEVYTDRVEESLEALSGDIDSVYLPPLFMDKLDNKRKVIIDFINDRKLPSFALLGEEDVKMGAMASIAPDQNLNAISRRIALNILNILSGQDGGELPVSVANYNENFVVNMATLQKIGYCPDWDALNEARLINLEGAIPGQKITIRSVIYEALEKNLNLQIEKMETKLREKEASIAKSSLYPQVTLSSSLSMLDENRANEEPSSPARYSWLVSGDLSQILYSDDVWANYFIQNKLAEAQKYQELTQVLDTVVNAAELFVNLLFAQTNRTIQNDNLNVTRKNLDIAQNKEAVGSSSSSEVHRWKSEQASNQITLNDAHRDFQLARLALNKLLNRSLTENIQPEDIVIESSIELLATDPEVLKFLRNFEGLAKFANFLTLEADRNLPELKQVEATLVANKREILNRKRSYYMPDLQLVGGIDKTLEEWETYSDTPSDLDHPWSIALTASWPLFDGKRKSHELQQSRIRLKQTLANAENLRKQLHLRVRSNLETAAVSYREVELAKTGLDSAEKNFEIIQAGYSEGRNSIADLIDAQNAELNAKQGYAIARYQFVLDFLLLERSVGRFHFLGEPGERESFINRLSLYMDSK